MLRVFLLGFIRDLVQVERCAKGNIPHPKSEWSETNLVYIFTNTFNAYTDDNETY